MALVAYLSSGSCAVSGHAYSALAGRYAEVVWGVRAGRTADDAAAVTAEDSEHNLAEMDAAPSTSEPRSI